MLSAGKKKAYLVVLVLGLGAVVVDRLIGYGTTSPSAAAGRPPETASPTPAAARAGAPGSNLESMFFPTAGEAGVQAAGGRDPFAAPPEVFALVSAAARAESEALAVPVAVAATYPSRHTLSAVLNLGGAKYAVLDGTLVAVGQVFDECELREISPEAARLRCLDGEVELRLQGPISMPPGR